MSRRAGSGVGPNHRAASHRRARPRRGRITLCALAASVTAIALLGGIGVMPKDGADAASAVDRLPRATASAQSEVATATAPAQSGRVPAGPRVLPADSGKGRRVVFAIGAQRVWLVAA